MSLAWRLAGLLLTSTLLVAAGCDHDHAAGDHADGHGHGHGDDHGDDHGGGDHHEDDGIEPLSITRWTETHELFVEFPPPAPGKAIRYLAHVTRLSDFQAVTEGVFHVRYRAGDQVAAESTVRAVARAGIFTPEFPPPATGKYQLEMVYEHQGVRATFDCGAVTVAAEPAAGEPGADGASLSFLKETQWKIPFATAWAAERHIAKEIELPAVVEPAGVDQLTIGAPTDGRFFHNPDLVIAEGRRIEKGDVIGSIAPTVAGDDYSRLRSDLEDAKLATEQAELEHKRIEPLVKEGLLPQRRLIEAQNALDRASSRLRSARRRLGQVVAPGGAGGLAIRSTLAGVVSQVLVSNGEAVEPGAPLVRIGGTERLWVRARFVARPAGEIDHARPAAVRLPSGARVELSSEQARFLSSAPVIDPASRIATWLVEINGAAEAKPPAADDGSSPHTSAPAPPAGASLQELRAGTPVVLLVRVGEPRSTLAVPRSAVVEINTRPFVFVQVEGESFDKRLVALGASDGPFVEIRSGITKGERIVTDGGFDIHLASLIGAVESHRH
ncbi:MAG: HlyD family efflux transporter periplasmic adaptor subunit [Deltaproteobacteria bacterium]|jgi:multidrug efflux pump subunit AcrA (membrane-fusion protein)|nr:HlyD family efflux transporter periplasmic adaptor subunit [Deltaproteobacteria bacterium]MBW2533486.1 HlyD family efflux transporter periplasmic adaptor subunit [Deltaproteobacteria bacterium]